MNRACNGLCVVCVYLYFLMSCLICQVVGCPVCVLLHCCVGCIVVQVVGTFPNHGLFRFLAVGCIRHFPTSWLFPQSSMLVCHVTTLHSLVCLLLHCLVCLSLHCCVGCRYISQSWSVPLPSCRMHEAFPHTVALPTAQLHCTHTHTL